MDQDRARAAWAAYLAGAPPAVLNFAPSSHVSVTRTVALDMAKVAERASAGTVFYTAWALVLSRHLDSDDVTFATPVSGREVFVKDIDRMDGPTLTVIPRRFRFGPKDATAAEALARAEEEAVEALKYSQHGMRGALKASGHGPALFDTMVNILPPRSGDEGACADRVFRRLGDRPSWKTEYTTLQIEVLQDGRVELGLSTTMEEFRARSVLEHFAKAVSWIAEQPDAPVQGLELVTEEEARTLLAPVDFPKELPGLLHEDFEEHARALSPYRVAMQWEDDEVMTYRMLDRRANQLARYLGARGLKRGQFACLLLDKSPLMLISILAVLKAGAAYVPLSPDNPVERNAYIAADVGAALLLSENASFQDFANPALAVVNLDEADFSREPKARTRVGISGDDVAYVIYTSGSTGKPKGCMIQHSAAAAAVRSMIKFEGREQGEWRALQFSNYIFDASVLDMFNTLSSGGTLCMASTARLLSDPAGVINEMGVMHSFLTPTVARFLCPGDVPTLRSLSIGGEPLAADILERWAGTRVVMNAYGPTETAMVAIMRDMRPGDNPRNLGKPLPTAQVLILERDGDAIVPYGAIGELCLVGPQVGQGYVGRPDLTAAVFIDAPAPVGEYKMYRSGDLARLLPGGEIECFGRKDFQVKVNGHRIELGEIEHAVIATGEVADCVVVVAQIASKPQLAAFVVFDESDTSASIQDPEAHADGATALKAKLGGLAHYMYPKLLLPLSGMPKMPSGKADRKLLTAWANNIDAKDLPRYSFDSFGAAAGSSPAAVPTETEQQHVLQDAFAEVLSADAGLLGKEANFLALGGDSIAAMNLVSAVRRRGYELSVRAVLQQPTLWLMAEQMEQLETDSAADAAVAEDSVPDDIARKMTAAGIMADDFEHVYACPPGQAEFLTEGKKKEKMWVLMTVRPLAHAADAWLKVVEKLTATNDILRTTYTQDGRGNWYGIVLKGAPVRITFIDIASEEDRARALDAIWTKDFDFGQPFIEYALLRWPSAADGVAAGKQELVTKMDHGLYDGTLLRIFASHFSALERGVPVDAHTTFRAFAAHHASDTKAKARALQYWTSDSARPTGFQYPRVASTAHPNATRTIVVPRTDAALLDALSASASAANVTVPIVFQAAFQLLLARQSAGISAAEAVGFDYLYTGRSVAALPDPQGINGNCATFLPLRCPAAVSADSSVAAVRSYLAETQDIFWRATEHAAVSLEEVYAAAGLHKESQRYRALFLFQPFEPAKPAAEGGMEPMRWVYMAGSEIRMPQPYGLVCEILRRVDGYAIKCTVDEAALPLSQAKQLAEEMWEIVTRLV
ncbi:AMP-dependent synthetase/ligase [Macrophomina phaseolina MS6]|uniref:AMP-dependent synthetase/ligase n=1 Tax=Macrophomina phaseolina (strain MS6) TaxID=1126212 RepID=K2S1A2_MACPH|nr:AMP-dependent synthetase/ligase [Macrophomina phaseolina MS6]